MVNVELIRMETNKRQGTFGVLKVNKSLFCCTLEPPDKGNKGNVSSIPSGQYMCRKRVSPQFGSTFRLVGVTDRSEILFHAGNVVEHTSGCILLGQYFGKLRDKRAVLNSGDTFRRFMLLMSDCIEFHLTISTNY